MKARRAIRHWKPAELRDAWPTDVPLGPLLCCLCRERPAAAEADVCDPCCGLPPLGEYTRPPDPGYGPLCRHCGRRRPNRPLGLCWGCYYTPGMRALYPSTSKYAPRERS
jgi:hypothetical protein